MTLAESNEATARRTTQKSAAAFRTISEVATELDVPPHVLRFWESKFPQIKPLKRGGGRRYYRPEDVDLLRRIRELLYRDGYTIKGVQKLLRTPGVRAGDEAEDAHEPEMPELLDGAHAEPEPAATEGAPDNPVAPKLPTLALAAAGLTQPLTQEAKLAVDEIVAELTEIRDLLLASPGRLAE